MRCSKTVLALGLLLLIGAASVAADDKKKGDYKKKGDDDDKKGPNFPNFGDDDDDDDRPFPFQRCSLVNPTCPFNNYCKLRDGKCKRCDRCDQNELQVSPCTTVSDTVCRKCSKLIKNCVKCSSATVCTQCKKYYTPYGLNGAVICVRNPPIGPSSVPPPPSPTPLPQTITLFTFEEFLASAVAPNYRIEPVPQHKGLVFANIGVANAPLNAASLGMPANGLINGQVTKPMVAYTYPSSTGIIASASFTFNLKYMYLTGAQRNGLLCTIRAFRNGSTQVAATRLAVSSTVPTKFQPVNWNDIDRISISCSGGTWAGYTANGVPVNTDNVVIDDLAIQFTTKPAVVLG